MRALAWKNPQSGNCNEYTVQNSIKTIPFCYIALTSPTYGKILQLGADRQIRRKFLPMSKKKQKEKKKPKKAT